MNQLAPEITATGLSHDPFEEKFDFNSPEDVLIEVIANELSPQVLDWNGYFIETVQVIGGANPDVTGAASYEKAYGGFLDYTIEGLIECPGEGWFVVEGVTADYIHGDGYSTDDDMRFSCVGVRPATVAEIAEA